MLELKLRGSTFLPNLCQRYIMHSKNKEPKLGNTGKCCITAYWQGFVFIIHKKLYTCTSGLILGGLMRCYCFLMNFYLYVYQPVSTSKRGFRIFFSFFMTFEPLLLLGGVLAPFTFSPFAPCSLAFFHPCSLLIVFLVPFHVFIAHCSFLFFQGSLIFLHMPR